MKYIGVVGLEFFFAGGQITGEGTKSFHKLGETVVAIISDSPFHTVWKTDLAHHTAEAVQGDLPPSMTATWEDEQVDQLRRKLHRLHAD